MDLNHNTPLEPAAETAASQDEALFQALAAAKKKKRTRRIILVLVIVALLGIGLFIGMRVMQQRVRNRFTSSSQEILNAAAERGTISTLVSGSGMIVNVDTEVVSVPSGVEVTKILVEYGDTVAEGDVLATVDMASVRTALSEMQASIKELDKQIASAKNETVSSAVTAGVSGRVKAIFAAKGDTVEDVMVANGSLALLSLDGKMELTLKTDALAAGDKVVIRTPDEKEYPGTVDLVLAGEATILVTDNGPGYKEEVLVLTPEGEEIGTAELKIHNSLAVTGYAGTVSGVNCRLNQQVSAAGRLFSLTDTSTTASYDALLRTRGEQEETLLELLKIQRNSALTAPIAGSVYATADLDEETSNEILDIVTLSPDVSVQVTITVDEADILSLRLGQQASVTVSSLGDEVLPGEVTEIDKTYTSGSYTAVITLDKVPGMIPGMTADVDIRIQGVDNALIIPADALHQTSKGYFVYTGYDEELKEYTGRVDVIPGLSNSSYVEIKSGLKEGDTVYYTKTQTFGWGSMNFGTSRTGTGTSSRTGSGMPGGMPSGMPGGTGGNRPPEGYSGGSPGSRTGTR